MDENGKSHKIQFHISGLNMFFRCGEQFRRRYIENEKIPPGIFLIVGSATDHTVNINLQNKIDNDELLPIEQIEDSARDQVSVLFKKGISLSTDEQKQGIKKVKGYAIDKAIRLSKLHAVKKAPILKPTHVQRSWTLDLNGYPVSIAGIIDIQEGPKSVRDTKTASKTPAKDVAERSDQLTMYALACHIIDKKIPDKVILDYLIDNKKPIAKSFESQRNLDDFKVLMARIENACTAIEKEVFVPVNSDHWICSPRWCGYWSSCRYARKTIISMQY